MAPPKGRGARTKGATPENKRQDYLRTDQRSGLIGSRAERRRELRAERKGGSELERVMVVTVDPATGGDVAVVLHVDLARVSGEDIIRAARAAVGHPPEIVNADIGKIEVLHSGVTAPGGVA